MVVWSWGRAAWGANANKGVSKHSATSSLTNHMVVPQYKVTKVQEMGTAPGHNKQRHPLHSTMSYMNWRSSPADIFSP